MVLQGTGIFWELGSNFAVILASVLAYGFLNRAFNNNHKNKYLFQVAMGLVFGVATFACMRATIVAYGGIVIDMRNAFIILAALFAGPISAIICATIAMVIRLHIEADAGAIAGCISIVVATISGCVFSKYEKKFNTFPKAMLSSVLVTLPIIPSFFLVKTAGSSWSVFVKVGLPYLAATSVGVFLGGLSMMSEKRLLEVQNSLRNSEKKYKDLFERLIDICFSTNANGKIEIISLACERIMGYSTEELIGTRFLDYFKNTESVGTFQFLMNKNGFVSNFEVQLKKKYGGDVWVSINARELFDENGAYSGIEAVARDVTLLKTAIQEKKQLQENFIQVQKMESLGIMAGGVAHDFNNALAGIMGGAEILQDLSIPAEMHQKYVNLILSSAERAGELTRKLLTFSRKETFVKNQVDIIPLLNDVISILRHTIDRRIVLKTEFKFENAWVIGDKSLLQSAFINLGINASHALLETQNPEITFILNTVELNDDYCRHSLFELSPGKYFEISVRDNGCGMSAEVVTQIFKPFFTTKEPGKGTGLGLSAVYGTVQEHNGAITVYSEVDHGTVFHLYIPYSDQHQYVANEDQNVKHGTGTILLIDDEELIRAVALTTLSKLGYKVLVAENGKVGLKIYEAHKDEVQLVILDMIMPVMSGRETFCKLRKLDPNLPVIISSGFAKEEDIEAQKEMGVAGFLRKPFRSSEMADMVAQVITKENFAKSKSN